MGKWAGLIHNPFYFVEMEVNAHARTDEMLMHKKMMESNQIVFFERRYTELQHVIALKCPQSLKVTTNKLSTLFSPKM